MKAVDNNPKRENMKLTPNEKRFKSFVLTPEERKRINKELEELENE